MYLFFQISSVIFDSICRATDWFMPKAQSLKTQYPIPKLNIINNDIIELFFIIYIYFKDKKRFQGDILG